MTWQLNRKYLFWVYEAVTLESHLLNYVFPSLQIVPTEYKYISKEVLPTNQFSVTEYFSPINEFDRNWPGKSSPIQRFLGCLPLWPSFVPTLSRGIIPCIFYAAVYFLYDLSPITVTIREERRSFLHFLTRLCAVLGGTFALTGLSCFPSIVFDSTGVHVVSTNVILIRW